MFFNIISNNGVAIYEQIARQVTFAVANGSLKPGELIPSVRELARELAVNPNTVARAFRELQTDKVLETVRGSGMAVATGAVERCRASRARIIRERVRQALTEARQSKLSEEELRTLVEAELDAHAPEEILQRESR